MFIILGSPRSGTTLLAQCLQAHPDIVIPHETDFIIPTAFLFDRVTDRSARDPLVARLITQSARFPSTLGEYVSSSEIDEIIARSGGSMSELLEGLYEAVARNGNCTIAGDKSPNDLLFLRMLVKVGGLAPSIRIVHIVRDVRDVLASLIRLQWDPTADRYFARFWCNSNLYVNNLFAGTPQYTLVRYEDLVREPSEVLARITAHVGAEFTPDQLLPDQRHQRYRTQEAHAHLYKPISKEMIGSLATKLPPSVVETIERQSAEAMKLFGYAFASEFGRAYDALPTTPD